MEMTHRKNAIVHTPGVIDANGIQRCTRCHAKLFNRADGWSEGSRGWQGLVISDRDGKATVSESEAAKYRPCGRKAVSEHSYDRVIAAPEVRNDAWCPGCGNGGPDGCILCGRTVTEECGVQITTTDDMLPGEFDSLA
jgi:hypothetical protein